MTDHECSEQIAQGLLTAGLRRGGVALVHSSLSSLGYVPGGAETVISGFLHALGPEGTLLMPALSYEHTNARHPLFDVRHTPSNVGLIPETFRTRPGTLRSLCPTHSVCGTGFLAERLLESHSMDDTPCGPHSPYRLLPEHDGQIVFLGCGMRPNTSMHSVEEVVLPPYLFGPMIQYRVILHDGAEQEQLCRSHDFRGWRQRYDRVADLLGSDALKHGKVMAADVYIVDARSMWTQALNAYRRDPLYFVDPY